MRTDRCYRTEGIVLCRHDFGEADRLISLFTPHRGKLRLLGKGTRRPRSRMAGHVELFTRVDVLVATGRNLDLITQAQALRVFPTLRGELWRTGTASYAVELVDRFTVERAENQALYDLLLRMLEEVEVAARPHEWTVPSFELHLLHLVGFAPELFHCLRCAEELRPQANHFSAALGGTLCPSCASNQPSARPITVDALKGMRLLLREPFGFHRRLRAPASVAAEVEGHLRAKITYLLERQPASAQLLDRLRAERARATQGDAQAPALA